MRLVGIREIGDTGENLDPIAALDVDIERIARICIREKCRVIRNSDRDR